MCVCVCVCLLWAWRHVARFCQNWRRQMFIPHKGEHMLFILRTVRERAERKREEGTKEISCLVKKCLAHLLRRPLKRKMSKNSDRDSLRGQTPKEMLSSFSECGIWSWLRHFFYISSPNKNIKIQCLFFSVIICGGLAPSEDLDPQLEILRKWLENYG